MYMVDHLCYNQCQYQLIIQLLCRVQQLFSLVQKQRNNSNNNNNNRRRIDIVPIYRRTLLPHRIINNNKSTIQSISQQNLLRLPSSLSSYKRSTTCKHDKLNNNIDDNVTKKTFLSNISWKRFITIVDKNFFIIGVIFAIVLARLVSEIGCNGNIVHPEILLNQYGVGAVFLLSGLSLEFNQLSTASSNIKLNFFIQFVSYIIWPILFGIPITRLLSFFQILPKSIIDGILIVSCLPTTINMCILLTRSANGNVAIAIWNAIISNTIGIVITPLWLFYFFNTVIELPFLSMIYKLIKKVLVPIVVGQLLRRITTIKNIYTKNSKLFKRFQEIILLSILWNSFCNSFMNTSGATPLLLHHVIVLISGLSVLHSIVLLLTFLFFTRIMKGLTRADVVAAMFCSSHKTMAFGLPLISTIFEGNPLLSSYSAPIMFLHPIQATIGSFLIPRLSEYTNETYTTTSEFSNA